MIYGKRFNIIHMPKTGGTWMRRVCGKLSSDIIDGMHSRHQPYAQLTPEQASKPTYILVRNPWDWYVSIYGHRHGNITKRRHEFALPYAKLDVFHRAVYDKYAGSFEHSLQDPSPWEFDESMGNPIRTMGGRFEYMRTPPEGAAPALVKRFEDGPARVLQGILEAHHGPLGPAVQKALQHAPENVSERNRAYQTYYTDETRALVAERERKIIESFSYTF